MYNSGQLQRIKEAKKNTVKQNSLNFKIFLLDIVAMVKKSGKRRSHQLKLFISQKERKEK